MAGFGKMKNRNDTALRRYAVTPSRCVSPLQHAQHEGEKCISTTSILTFQTFLKLIGGTLVLLYYYM
jgi:hypothetical protein